MPKRATKSNAARGRSSTMSARPPPPVKRPKVAQTRSDRTDRGGGALPSRELITSRTAYFDSLTNPLVAPPAAAPVNCRRSHVARFQEYVDVTNDTDAPISGKFVVVPDVDAPLIYSGPGDVRLARPPADASESLSKSGRKHIAAIRTGRDRIADARLLRHARANGGIAPLGAAAATPSPTPRAGLAVGHDLFNVDWFLNSSGSTVESYQSLGDEVNTSGQHSWVPGYSATLWNPSRAPAGVLPPAGVVAPGTGVYTPPPLCNLLPVDPAASSWSVSFTRTGPVSRRFFCLDADRNVLSDSGTLNVSAAASNHLDAGSAIVSGTRVHSIVYAFGRTDFPAQPPAGMLFSLAGFDYPDPDAPAEPPLPPFDPNSPLDYSLELSGYAETADAFDAVRNESTMVTATYTGSTLSNAGQIATVQMPYAQLQGYGDFPNVPAIREVQGSYSGPLKAGCNTVNRPSLANLEWRGLLEVSPDAVDPYDWSQLPVIVSAFEGLEPGQSIRIRYVGVWSFETRVQIFCPQTLPVDQPSFQAAVAVMSRLPNSTANGTHAEYWRDVARRYTVAAAKYVMADPVSFAAMVIRGVSALALV